MSFAYFGGEVDLPALLRVIDKASPRPVVVGSPLLSLIELARDEHLYT